ncbi:MAG: DUF2244 domain-containing protein [Rhodomicrobium sp.]|nr:DUF2244 domain-containing protein [Rhodomicrobium sp.]
MSETAQTPPDPTQFSAVLLPHRSLGRKGFIVLMIFISAISFVTGLGFYMLGAWPVMGFFGLDVLLIYGAFRLNYRAARLYETVELRQSELKVTRVYPSGRSQSWSFNPYWVRLELEESETTANRLSLRSHGRVFPFASFLSNDEKRGFAHALQSALYDLRGSRI